MAYGATIDSVALPDSTTDLNNLTGLGNLWDWSNYDVVDNSWTFGTAFSDSFLANPAYQQTYINAVANGRGGLGTVLVFAGGIDATADLGSLIPSSQPFSEPGASILVSAPANNITSDGVTFTNDYGQQFGADTETAAGTSFATPIVSGIVALMLEANPDLGYRDIQQILAYSADRVNDPTSTTVDPDNYWVSNLATNLNGGGLHYSLDYGFGEVDARAAVRLAETWQKQQTYANMTQSTVQTPSIEQLPVSVTANLTNNNGTIGFGLNTLSFAKATEGVTVSLNGPVDAQGYTDITAGYAAGTRFKNIQNITGSSDDDVLTGNGGNNVLDGGGGDDTYVFDAGYGQDTIINGVATVNGVPWLTGPAGQLTLGAGLGPSNLWFSVTGEDLVIQVIGTTSQITLQGWFTGTASQLASLTLADGSSIGTAAMTALVEAMSAYQAANPGFDAATAAGIPGDPTLQAAFAAGWTRSGGADMPTVTTGVVTVFDGHAIAASSLIASVSDLDGDAITQYQFYDPSLSAIQLNGATNLLGQSYQAQGYYRVSAADLSKLTYVGSTPGSEILNVMAYDGYAWGGNTVTVTTILGTSSMTSQTSSLVSPAIGADGATIGANGTTTLTGTSGHDVYSFTGTPVQETIVNGTAAIGAPSGELDMAFASDQLWFQQAGNDLLIDVLGTAKQADVKNWFADTATTSWEQLSKITSSDGLSLTAASSVAVLIQSMASFTSDYSTSHNGIAFDTTAAANATISDPTVLAAVSSSWHH